MEADFRWDNPFGRDIEYGFVRRDIEAPQTLTPRILTNGADGTMLRALREELRSAHTFVFSVAFVSPGAIALLKQELVEFVGSGTIVTSDYLGFNSPEAFRELLALRKLGIDVRIHGASAFHPKGYIFSHHDHVTAIMGSSNLTKPALVSNHEWNLRVSALPDSDLQSQLVALVDQQISASEALTNEWIDAYAESYVAPVRAGRARPVVGAGDRMPDPTQPVSSVVPNEMQLEALAALDASRRSGKDRALVISATGTGKTILSALDVRAVDPERMLFLVHREQILDRAMTEYARVLGVSRDEMGKLSGTSKELDKRFVFATVNSFARPEFLATVDPTEFEYVLVDEAHRAGSRSYQRVLHHLRPTFLLGMTATPERTDGYDLFQLFDYNVAYEIRLGKALEADMLAPFHYFGVADYTTEDGVTTDEFSGLAQLVATARVDYLVDEIETYGHAGMPVRGLIFCRSKEEAHRLSESLNSRSINGKRLRTRALTGDDSIAVREEGVKALERGEIDYIVTVDIFNEGIDIPSVNQIVMLRQTQSAIVFVQQLGRGLRRAPGKDALIVIDFIGNYANNFMIPIALFGDSSLNKESLRKNLIGAEEVGVVAGLSSVRFDKIAQDRVLSSIVSTKLDSLVNLKQAIVSLQRRLGRFPQLVDFLRFESADPVVLATTLGSYPALVERVCKLPSGLTPYAERVLLFLSAEVLSAKRGSEAAVLKQLVEAANSGRPSSRMLDASTRNVDRVFTHEFFTEAEQKKYGAPIAVETEGVLRPATNFARELAESEPFRRAVNDIVETATAIAKTRYAGSDLFVPGLQYSRKDACRLLGWRKNVSSTIYGYKVDAETQTCPIFVTLHKSDDVSASTAYGDKLTGPSTMHWLTRSRRTLQSGEVAAIVSGAAAVHVFVKKDDAQGTDFYYLGRARSESAEQTFMPDDDGKPLPVVEVSLRFDAPIEAALFDYFEPVLTV